MDLESKISLFYLGSILIIVLGFPFIILYGGAIEGSIFPEWLQFISFCLAYIEIILLGIVLGILFSI